MIVCDRGDTNFYKVFRYSKYQNTLTIDHSPNRAFLVFSENAYNYKSTINTKQTFVIKWHFSLCFKFVEKISDSVEILYFLYK